MGFIFSHFGSLWACDAVFTCKGWHFGKFCFVFFLNLLVVFTSGSLAVEVNRRCCSPCTESDRGRGRSRSPPARRSSANTWSTAGATAGPRTKCISRLRNLPTHKTSQSGKNATSRPGVEGLRMDLLARLLAHELQIRSAVEQTASWFFPLIAFEAPVRLVSTCGRDARILHLQKDWWKRDAS